MDLFNRTTDSNHEPLAYRMRPRTLEEFTGQAAIIGEGRLLRRIIQADRLSSIIFYGPPGTGKTTLARIIAGTTKSHFITINAVLSGVKDLRTSIDDAREKKDLYGRRTILFIDEVHRWNKAQQDALLPWVENGTIIMIGATTANPYFEVNPALVSRSRIFQLKSLSREDLLVIAQAAMADPQRGYGRYDIEFEEGALEHIVEIANGDARSLLNALELAVETTPASFPPPAGEKIHISLKAAEESIQKKVVLYDKEGDYHFDTISAFIKALRGSDPDAALYWLARMIRAGEDPRFIFRRMLILSCEDVGLADPYALGVVEAAAAAFDRIGMPEGRYHLAHAALYLANTTKSNSSMGFFDALKVVEEESDDEVPRHLKDANRDGKDLGHGEGYLYPHAYRDHWVAQDYLPRNVSGTVFYHPGALGWESSVRESLERRRELQTEAGITDETGTILSHSPGDSSFDVFYRRFLEDRESELADIRERIFTFLKPNRTDRILVLSPGNTSLIWEALRRTPEGGVWVVAPDAGAAAEIEKRAASFPEDRRPAAIMTMADFPCSLEAAIRFECIIGRDWFTRNSDPTETLQALISLLAPAGGIALAQVLPGEGTRLSNLASGRIVGTGLDDETLSAFSRAEEMIYTAAAGVITRESLEKAFQAAGCPAPNLETIRGTGNRRIDEGIVASWFDSDRPGSYGNRLKDELSPEEAARIREAILPVLSGRTIPWERVILLITSRL